MDRLMNVNGELVWGELPVTATVTAGCLPFVAPPRTVHHDLALIASALASISEAVARVDPHYQTLDREKRLTDALNAMAKRLGA